MKYAFAAVVCCLGLACNENATTGPGSPPASATRPVARPDDTSVNVRDRDGNTKTPIDQNENKEDIEITSRIRKQVVDGKLSTAAKNVKIITQDGKVTLRGPVDSMDEKDNIEQIAVGVAGAGQVDNQLEVAPPKSQ